jgi:hypothetical protein
LGDLEDQYLEIYDEVYLKKITDKLKGKEANEFFERLRRNDKKTEERAMLLT